MYPRFFFASIGSRTTSWPATNTLPELGGIMPHNVRKVVVLPAPFGPSNPRIWPGSTEKLRFFTAVKPLYCLLNDGFEPGAVAACRARRSCSLVYNFTAPSFAY
jgi:hypothetical protein